jgi:predicted phage-related endonuclease
LLTALFLTVTRFNIALLNASLAAISQLKTTKKRKVTMSDFSPSTRNSAIWSGDSRKVANGKANEVILTKLGMMDIPDLSDIEAVQMGHVMEPVIARLAQNKLQVELTKIEESLTHKTEPWLRSHFDFVGTENGKPILVECKNYNAATRNKFDADTGVIPAADMAQLVHEATVYGCEKIYLAVLFGGSEFFLCPFEIGQEQKLELVKTMAQVWARVQTRQPLPPESVEQVKLMYKHDDGNTKTASGAVEEACRYLALIKSEIKALEAREEAFQTVVQGYMQDKATLTTVEGQILATWKNAKPSKRFDSKLFQDAMPDIYAKFIYEQPGSRRFLVK